MNKKTKIFLTCAIAILIAVFDQVLKFIVIKNISLYSYLPIVENLLGITYLQNTGIAFGIFQNAKILFTITTIAIIAFIFYLNFYKINGKFLLIFTSIISGGALGNLIDRIFRGFVVDYIYVSFFPAVFNFADACITIGSIFLFCCIIFNKN